MRHCYSSKQNVRAPHRVQFSSNVAFVQRSTYVVFGGSMGPLMRLEGGGDEVSHKDPHRIMAA